PLHQADIVNGIAHHGQARQAKAKGKAVPLTRVKPGIFNHVWMHQTARQKFNPSAVFANRAAAAAADEALNIQLKAGLNKRKISRAQADCNLAAKDRAQQSLHEIK